MRVDVGNDSEMTWERPKYHSTKWQIWTGSVIFVCTMADVIHKENIIADGSNWV